jgi:DNA-binding CsgD family transcriptional regulator
MINGLECLARVAALTDGPEASARLLAAVTAAREQSELARWPPEPDVWSAVEHDIRAELGNDAFARAWADGLVLSLEVAAAYALRGHDQREREHDEESLEAPELLLGDLDEARDDALHGLAWALKQGDEKVEARVRDRLGCVALARGALVDAEDQLQQSLAIGLRRDFRERLISSLESLARVAALTDSPAEAARLLAAVAGAREQSKLVRWPPQAGFWAAFEDDLRVQLGDDAFARAWADGLKLSLEDAAAYARRGRGQRKRPKHGWESLTPTELQVVRHVAGGLTNPQIGERMYISRGTVKAHLSHVFAKLDVSNRQTLTAEAIRRGLDAAKPPEPPVA